MTYVDLNPIRAGIAATPEESDFTSIHQRICELRRLQEEKEAEDAAAEVKIHLRAFSSADVPLSTIPYRFDDYLDLVDWTGRTIRSDKRGSIDERLPPIVQRLNINPDAWHRSMQRHGNVFGRAMGRLDHLRLHASTLGNHGCVDCGDPKPCSTADHLIPLTRDRHAELASAVVFLIPSS
jgi:hypothetical protein